MSHNFDTGLAGAQRTQIRNGAVALLAGLLKTAGGYLQAVIPWGGIVRGYTDEQGIDDLAIALEGRSPAVAIALGDMTSKPAGIGGFNFTGALELVAYFYSSHPRGVTEGRLAIDAAGLASDTADPGLEAAMEQVMQLLVGQRCGVAATVKQVRPRSEDELRTEDAFTLWAQRYDLEVTRKINANRGVSQTITEFRSNVRQSSVAPLAITAAVEAANVATYTTALPHELKIDDLVIVDGVGVAGYNGALFVASTPTATTFTAQLPITGLGASGGGTVTPRPVAALKNPT
jgi:hypothetical protein